MTISSKIKMSFVCNLKTTLVTKMSHNVKKKRHTWLPKAFLHRERVCVCEHNFIYVNHGRPAGQQNDASKLECTLSLVYKGKNTSYQH